MFRHESKQRVWLFIHTPKYFGKDLLYQETVSTLELFTKNNIYALNEERFRNESYQQAQMFLFQTVCKKIKNLECDKK